MGKNLAVQVKKTAALVLALMLLLGAVGCGEEDTAKQLYGTWELNYDMGPMISEELGDDYADFQSPLEMKLLFDFNEDGTYKMYVDEASFRTSWDTWKSAFIDYMVNVLYEQMEAEGVSRSLADLTIQETYGCSVQEYITQLADESFDVETLLADIETSSKFETKGNKLYMADEGADIAANQYDHFEVENDVLTLSLVDDSQDAEILPGLSYPLELKKVTAE